MALPLKPIPIADRYTTRPMKQERYPVDLYRCVECGHVQLSDVIDPELLFREYGFRSGENPGMVKHLEAYAQDVLSRFRCEYVVEIGSNDGTLLKHFQKAGKAVMGYDPADIETSVPTLKTFFDEEQGSWHRHLIGSADVIIANHVFAHADDLHSIARGVKALLHDEGVFIVEFAYLLDMLENQWIDTVYHEHLSYHHITPLVAFFERHGLHVNDADYNSCKGGSMRLFVGNKPGRSSWLDTLIEHEEGFDFDYAFEEMRQSLYLANKSEVGECVGFGAGPGATSVMVQLGLEQKVKYLVDENPGKVGLFGPLGHEIKSVEHLPRSDTVVVLPFRYTDQLRARYGTQLMNPMQGCA